MAEGQQYTLATATLKFQTEGFDAALGQSKSLADAMGSVGQATKTSTAQVETTTSAVSDALGGVADQLAEISAELNDLDFTELVESLYQVTMATLAIADHWGMILAGVSKVTTAVGGLATRMAGNAAAGAGGAAAGAAGGAAAGIGAAIMAALPPLIIIAAIVFAIFVVVTAIKNVFEFISSAIEAAGKQSERFKEANAKIADTQERIKAAIGAPIVAALTPVLEIYSRILDIVERFVRRVSELVMETLKLKVIFDIIGQTISFMLDNLERILEAAGLLADKIPDESTGKSSSTQFVGLEQFSKSIQSSISKNEELDEAKKQTNLLNDIKGNTAPAGGGKSNPFESIFAAGALFGAT